MRTIKYNGNTFTLNTFGTPDCFIGTEEDIPNNFYWKNGFKKEDHHWIMKKSAIELGFLQSK